jgi:hypothetical protein
MKATHLQIFQTPIGGILVIVGKTCPEMFTKRKDFIKVCALDLEEVLAS